MNLRGTQITCVTLDFYQRDESKMHNVVIESIDNYSHMKVNGRLLPEGLQRSEMIHTYIFIYISTHTRTYTVLYMYAYKHLCNNYMYTCLHNMISL